MSESVGKSTLPSVNTASYRQKKWEGFESKNALKDSNEKKPNRLSFRNFVMMSCASDVRKSEIGR